MAEIKTIGMPRLVHGKEWLNVKIFYDEQNAKDFLNSLSFSFEVELPQNIKVTSGDSLEHKQVQSLFLGRSWPEIDLPFLNKYKGDASACIWFMTPEALRYYLPAYMKISLLDYEAADSIPDALVTMLLRSSEEPASRERWGLNDLDVKQKEVVANFLLILDKTFFQPYSIDDAKVALDKYWGRFL